MTGTSIVVETILKERPNLVHEFVSTRVLGVYANKDDADYMMTAYLSRWNSGNVFDKIGDSWWFTDRFGRKHRVEIQTVAAWRDEI